MASNNSDVRTVVLRGKASYAKILGNPVLNYSKDGKEWKMDLVLTKEGLKEVKGYGIGDRVKQKDDYLDGEPFLTFKQSELKKDGSPNQPIKVTDIADNPWPQNKLIGNGSDVDVKFVVMDHGAGKKKGVYIRSVRVLDLVPYERKEFEALDESDPFYAKLKEAEALAAANRARDNEQFARDFGLENEADGTPADLDDDLPL